MSDQNETQSTSASEHPRNAQPDSKIRVTFDDSIKRANNRSRNLYQQYVFQYRISFWITIFFFVLAALISLWLLWAGVSSIDQSSSAAQPVASVSWSGILEFASGLFLLFILFLNHPLKSARKSQLELMRFNFIFTGYMHQLHLTEARFQDSFSQPDFDAKGSKSFSDDIQAIMEQAVDMLNSSMDEFLE
jgi:ABC-type multidrug transport system fused ATPase/permease subunit